MKYILALGLAFLPFIVSAQETTVSTVTYTNVAVSTYTPTRVDNLLTGGGTGIIIGRSEILIASYSGNATIHCGYDVNVSTIAGNVNRGIEIVGGSTRNISISSVLAYYCQAVGTAASAVWVHIEQAAKKIAPGQ